MYRDQRFWREETRVIPHAKTCVWIDQACGIAMIDEYWTWMFYGYHSDELKPQSNKPIVMVCDVCCKYRIGSKNSYRGVCHNCSMVGHSDDTRHKISEATKGKNNPFHGKKHSKESRKKMSDARKGLVCDDKTRKKMSDTHKGEKHWNYGKHMSYDARVKSSATQQGIPYEEWTEFVSNGEYCEKFDETCRARIRAKYDHRCFVCDLPQEDNITKTGKHIKLSVHHSDRNRAQGCNGVKWSLVPLCMHCHPGAHSDPLKSRIEYLLNNEDM